MNEMKWLKEGIKDLKTENSAEHKEILARINKLGEDVDLNQNKINTLEGTQKSHFFMHKKIDGMSRTQATVLIAIIQIIAMVIIAIMR